MTAPSAELPFNIERFYTEYRSRMFGAAWQDHDVATCHEHVEALEATVQAAVQFASSAHGTVVRSCTCHPDDNPPVPCPQKFALSECRAAVSETINGARANDPVTAGPEGSSAPSASGTVEQSQEDAACRLVADLLRKEIKRLEYPRSMFPQQAENIGRRIDAFLAAIRFLEGE